MPKQGPLVIDRDFHIAHDVANYANALTATHPLPAEGTDEFDAMWDAVDAGKPLPTIFYGAPS